MRQININEYNVKELMNEGRITSNTGKFFDTKPKVNNKNELGIIDFNGVNFRGCSYIEWKTFLHEDVKISQSSNDPHLAMHFVINGSYNLEVKNQGEVMIKQNTNNLWLFNDEYSTSTVLEKDISCTSAGFYFHNHFLEEIINRYPDLLEKLFKGQNKNGKIFHHGDYLNTTFEMTQIISQIKNADLLGNAREIYAEAKILELLALQINGNDNTEKSNTNRNFKKTRDSEKINEAKNILTKNLDKPISISWLAKEIGINESKLKYGFREVYNNTVFGCLFDYKMEVASKYLLDTNKSILEIASICGYEYASHFTTAFKRKFGVSPKEFRKKTSY